MRRLLIGLGVAAVFAAVGWGFYQTLARRSVPAASGPAASAATASGEAAERRIRATLFYVAENGINLTGVEREVPFGDGTVEQAQRLIEGALQPVDPPLLSPIPDGTSLRSVFITDRGEAYVDMSAEISTRHPGGALEELFTVYAIVNVLTVNLPAVQSVQILVDGREVDTIAGHIDMRRPLVKNLMLLPQPEPPASPTPATSPPAQ